MVEPLFERLVSSRPLRRAAAGVIGGFAACLSITWIERAVHLLSPLTNLGVAVLDVQISLGWAFLCLLAFAGLDKGGARMAVLLIAPLPFLGLAVWMNAPALRGPDAFRVLMPTVVLVATVGGASALLGNRLDDAWSKDATS